MPKRSRTAPEKKTHFTIASWNVLSIRNNPSASNLCTTLENSRVDLAALQSTRRCSPDKPNLFFADANQHEGGMAIWVKQPYAHITKITHRHPRMMLATIATYPPLLVVNFYAPCIFSPAFWHLLDETIDYTRGQLDGSETLILCGDANAHISLADANFAHADAARFPLHTDENGEQLLMLCHKHNLSAANFHQRNRHKPWKHLNTFTQVQLPHHTSMIDYICVPTTLLQSCTHPLRTSKPRGFFSDHKLLELVLPTPRPPAYHPSRHHQHKDLPTSVSHHDQITLLNKAIATLRASSPRQPHRHSMTYHPPPHVLRAHKELSHALLSTHGTHTRAVRRRHLKLKRHDLEARKAHNLAIIRNITSKATLFNTTRVFLRQRAFKKRNTHEMALNGIARELSARILETRTLRTHVPRCHFESHAPPNPQLSISIYTDGSFYPRSSTSPAYGGWAFIAILDAHTIELHCGNIAHCRSAYQAEVYATMRALMEYPAHNITLFTD